VRITFDPVKRAKTLTERGLDFADAALIFTGVTMEIEDTRRNYGEKRVIYYGAVGGTPCRRGLHGARRGASRLQHEEGP
jgi:uncharacterized protein